MLNVITKSQVQNNNPDLCITDEVWKPISGFEYTYQVSNYGNVISLQPGHFGCYMTQRISNAGYLTVCLSKTGKYRSYSIHRLVASAFLSMIDDKDVVNHKDGNKFNNYVGNLEWCTTSENAQHAINIGLRIPETEAFKEAGRIASCKPVVILETGEVFESGVKCCEIKGYPKGYVDRMFKRCDGYASTYGVHFKRISYEDYLRWVSGNLKFEPQKFEHKDYLHRGLQHSSKCVRVVETGECFSSCRECDKKYGFNRDTTNNVLKRTDRYYGKADLHFERISSDEYVEWLKNPIVHEHKPNIREQILNKLSHGGYCIKVVETGKCYATAKECDKHLNQPKNFTSKLMSKYGGYNPKISLYHFIKISVDEYLEYIENKL